MTEQMFERVDDYLSHMFTETLDQLDEASEDSDGLPCPSCLAHEFVEANRTLIMSEVYALAKTDPQAAMAMFTRALLLHRAMGVVSLELMQITNDLFDQDCFVEDGND